MLNICFRLSICFVDKRRYILINYRLLIYSSVVPFGHILEYRHLDIIHLTIG
jgi:hypothetical protein